MTAPRTAAVALAALSMSLTAACTTRSTIEISEPSSARPSSATQQSPSPTAPGGSPTPAESSSPSTPGSAAPSATEPAWLDDWDIGARTLPLRSDGFGQRRPTPRELRVRRMPTVDALAPPPTDEFRSSIRRIGPRIRDRMGTSWERGCPVRLRDLRYVRVVFHGFDKQPHTGELIVHEDHARGVVRVFRKLYDARFPIEQMTLPTSNKRDTTPSGDGNGTGAMVCRATTGATSYSAHAYGLAIDLNPFQNPYLNDGLLIPELAGAYLDRSWHRPGMIRPNGVVVRAFADIGWSWGGDWRTLKDYQHFTATGR